MKIERYLSLTLPLVFRGKMGENTSYEASWRVKLIIWIARRLGFEEPGLQVLVPYVPHQDKVTVEQLVYLKKVDRRPVKYQLERV